MIKEFSVRVKPSNKKAAVITAASFIIAALFTVVYLLVERYRSIIGIFVLVFITAGIFVYQKYVGSALYYDITADYRGEPILVIRQMTGKRATTLARLGLKDITSVEMESASAAAAHQTPKGYRRYSYLPTVSPENVCRLTVVTPYESSEVVIECSAEFSEMLISFSDQARQMSFSDDEI